MNINIYIEDHLAKQLSYYAQKFHKKRNSIIREALNEWLQHRINKTWPESVMEFEGIEDFPDIKELREDIIEHDKKLF